MRRSRWFAIAVAAAMVAMPVLAGDPAVAAKPQPGAVMLNGINLDTATVLDLQKDIRNHKLSSVALTAFYLARIHRLNPSLHAVIETNPDAIHDAIASDLHRVIHGARSPLEGIPVLLKDNVGTGDREHTTAGSFALIGDNPADAFLVTRLRAAGAIILGKANLSEWANFRSLTSSSGWSGRGGQANNPYVLDRNPCGSSSGSAAAAAADLATVTIGTETDGSIV
ncbi:MAG TPA: amidase family protein, partial [Micromonosporaceae bacterium]|nr:amidase family protein [Micromonosporaceae bacterium]